MSPGAVLDFWFGAPGSAEYGRARRCWFVQDPAFDEEIRGRFGAVVAAAAHGRLGLWTEGAESVLALILLLDQFPRNLFRNEPRAFATDGAALHLAREALAQGYDAQLLPVQRVFLYLPLEHSEELAMQERAVELFTALTRDHPGFDDFLDYARRHRDVIARFGRFPHRNAILGRESTPEELGYLARPGAGF